MHSSISHNNLKGETTKVSINCYSVVQPYNGIVLGDKREWSNHSHYHIDENIMLSKKH